ncbi:MAG: hypothetical protein ABW221_08075 [Vicinamibacteria bacterium]
MHRITTLAAGLLALAAASDAFAGESALVGRLKQDGTIEIDKGRFLPGFPDGTPVATIEATPAAGGPRLTRASSDGCLAETTVLRVAATAAADGSRGLWAVDWHPIQLKRCYDDGCQAEFDHGAWDAKCEDISTFTCVCVRRNFDQVIIETQGYCKRFQTLVDVWDLDDWVFPQFVQ